MQSDELRVLRSAGELDALAGEWNDLAARCPGYFFSQTCRWAEAAWQHVAQRRGRTLQCLTLRTQGRLVAVWPWSSSAAAPSASSALSDRKRVNIARP
jgi:hypothetical protein